jgi:hypothetical protein
MMPLIRLSLKSFLQSKMDQKPLFAVNQIFSFLIWGKEQLIKSM